MSFWALTWIKFFMPLNCKTYRCRSNLHLTQSGHYLNRYSSFFDIFLKILVSFWTLTGGSHMDGNFLSLKIVELADTNLEGPRAAQLVRYLMRYSSF